MSETEQDVPFEEPAAPVEPSEDEEAADEEAQPEGEPAEGEQPTEEEAQAEADAVSEKEIEKRFKALEKLRTDHAGRVSKLLQDDAVFVEACPMCADLAPGWLWKSEAAPLAPETEANVRLRLGMNVRGQFKAHPHAKLCETCDGLGSVETPSKVPGYDVVDCPDCAATGRLLEPTAPTFAPPTNGAEWTPPQPAVEPSAYEHDPRVESLRAEGVLVVPPVITGPTVQ